MIFVAKVVRRSANFLRARTSVRMPLLRTSIFRKTAVATRGFCILYENDLCVEIHMGIERWLSQLHSYKASEDIK